MNGGRWRLLSRSRRFGRVLAAGPIGALIAVGLSVIPATTVQAQVVRHTRAAEVAGPLLAGAEVRALPFPTRHVALYWAGNPEAVVTVAFTSDGTRFTAPVKVTHDEVGMQRGNGETYGALLPAGGATSARVTSDRPLGRLTILALTEEAATVKTTEVPKNPAGAQTVDPGVVPGLAGWPTRGCASTGGARKCGRRCSRRCRSWWSITRPAPTASRVRRPGPPSGRSTTTTRSPRAGVTSGTTS